MLKVWEFIAKNGVPAYAKLKESLLDSCAPELLCFSAFTNVAFGDERKH